MPSEPISPSVNAELFSSSECTSERANAAGNRMTHDAFSRFYEQTSRSLFGYLWRVSGERDLAEDLLQESYCRLLSSEVGAMTQAETKSYLFRIATNLLHDHWRRQRRSWLAGILATTDADCEQSPDIHGSLRRNSDLEAQTGLRSAFERLKPRERQLLYLAYIEGSSHQEIADATGLRVGSIRLLLFRARKKLAGLLRAEG